MLKFWKKKPKEKEKPISLADLKLSFKEVKPGTKFKYYNSNSRRDIISGEGGSVLLRVCHQSGGVTYLSLYTALWSDEEREYTPDYYLCNNGDRVVLLSSEDIRIIDPKPVKKKAKKKAKKK